MVIDVPYLYIVSRVIPNFSKVHELCRDQRNPRFTGTIEHALHRFKPSESLPQNINMVSSLAAQLSQNASLNSAFLLEKSRRKVAQSYLFSLKEADHHDLESIHALGVNGFLQLSLLEPSVRKYEDALFSDSAKVTDRTLLAEEVARRLDQAIEGFLPLLGTYLLEIPTGKVIEWLVRRFRYGPCVLYSLSQGKTPVPGNIAQLY